MKRLKLIITHPLLIILLFCGIIISGEEMGGFYLLYILLGLPHFVIHSILGISGIFCLMLAYYIKKSKGYLFNIFGASCMCGSLIYFFIQPNASYNYGTFHETLPMITLCAFGALVTYFIISNSIQFIADLKKSRQLPPLV
ncbi:hypothetical protein [Parafilimonas sp.]|uniref:hypothetical protein n=1 Tax=Parafilimonas sp. TaxID=1969739 RepID=UPI0039E5A57F